VHDCRSKRWSGTNRTAPLRPANNQLLLCWKLACLLAVFNRTCALLHIVGISAIIIIQHHRYGDFSRWHGEMQVKLCRFTAHSLVPMSDGVMPGSDIVCI
jgi:hypothetical protein